MNINDIEKTNDIPADIWKAIWDKQRQLADKYKDIEGMGDLLDTIPTNVDTLKGQRWIKDFAWRVTEELTEADEAKFELEELMDPLSSESWDRLDDDEKETATQLKQHYLEEVTDALHFFVELCIIAGYEPEFFNEITALGERNSYDVIYQMGLMCNCLKNKPWKQTQMLTDRKKFEGYLFAAFDNLVKLFYNEGLADVDIYQFYFKKNAVNQFRIRSKY